MKCQLPHISVLCLAALLCLFAARAVAEEQPDGLYAQPSQDVVRKLLNIARKACRGKLDNTVPDLLNALNLDGPVPSYQERPAPEIAMIPVRHCPDPSPNAEFIVGRFARGTSYYYKTSARTARPIEAARSFFDSARNDVVFEAIAVTREVQENYNSLIRFLMTKWGG